MELSRRRKQMLVTGAALGGVLLAFVVFISVVDRNWLKRPIQRVASARANRAVTIEGNLRGHVWSRSPSVTVEGLRIANPSWDSAQPTADIQRLTIEVQLSQLLRGHLVLRRVELIRPQLYLHREKSGRANYVREHSSEQCAR